LATQVAVIEYNGYHEMTVSNVVETLKLLGYKPVVFNDCIPVHFRRSDIKVDWRRIEEYNPDEFFGAILTTVENAPTKKLHENMFAIHHSNTVIDTEYKQIRTHPKFNEFYFPIWMGDYNKYNNQTLWYDYVIQGNTESFRRDYDKLEEMVENSPHKNFLIIGQKIENIDWATKYDNVTTYYNATSDIFYRMIGRCSAIYSCISNRAYESEIVSSSVFLSVGMVKPIEAPDYIKEVYYHSNTKDIYNLDLNRKRYLRNNLKVIDENINI